MIATLLAISIAIFFILFCINNGHLREISEEIKKLNETGEEITKVRADLKEVLEHLEAINMNVTGELEGLHKLSSITFAESHRGPPVGEGGH